MTVEKPDTIDRITGMGAADLTSKAQSGQLSRAYGRDVEVEKVLSALARHRSVLLLGASEVGKTAILHEVTQRMIRRHRPRRRRRQVGRRRLDRRRHGRHALPRRVADAPQRVARRRQVRQQPLPLLRGHLGAARRRARLRQVRRLLHLIAPIWSARTCSSRRVHPRQLQRRYLRRAARWPTTTR